MKKAFLYLAIIITSTFFSCNSTRETTKKVTSLEGIWELDYISGPRIAFSSLYPNRKPTITFDLKVNRFSGNSSCNNYNGILNESNSTISFKEPIVATRMMCPDIQGENIYMSMLNKIDAYSITEEGRVLNFIKNEVILMRFVKK
jgi:heat shock protein HslJ